MAAIFQTTSEAHQQFSKIASEVRENNNIAIITKNGKPFLALLPADEVNDTIKHTVAKTRDVNNQWGKFVELATNGNTVYITYKDIISLQLIQITQDELRDIIIAYSKDLQNTYSEILKPENIKKHKSARELLNERKQIRAKNNNKKS